MLRLIIIALTICSLATLASGLVLAQEHVPDAHTAILLHLNDSLVGAAGETPLVAAGYGYGAGIFNHGVTLPSGNRVTYPSSGNITSSEGTAEFWFRPDWNGNDGQDHLAIVWDTGGGILMGKDGGNYWRIILNRWGLYGNPERGTGINVSSEWNAGEWHHCAFTWSSVKVRLFVDGVLRSEEPVGYALPAISATSFQIGGEGTSASLGGTLDELRLSDVARSDAEIFDSFARGLTFTALQVAPDPVTVTEGFAATPQVTATRQGGQQVSVPPALCAWTISDPSIATVDSEGAIHGLQQGTTGATCTWHGVSDPFTIEVEAALPPPGGLAAAGYHTTAFVHWDAVTAPGVAGYEVQRRPAGGAFSTVKRVLARTSFTDYGLAPGQPYEYRVAAIDAGGMPLTQFSAGVTATPDLSANAVSRSRNLDVLVAFYTAGYTPDEVSRMTAGLQTSMEFYWRTSGATLNFDPTWLYIDAALPASEWGAAVENDLRARGVQNDQYDLAYLIGNGLNGCYGGYMVLGSTCAALGTVCGVPYPENRADVDYTIVWTFTHEIHHALELMENVTGDGTPEVLFCHFPWCYPDPLGWTGRHMDWGSHYDGIALTNRDYGASWFTYPAPYDGVIECVDADQDGLPDEDLRVWSDEARFGSNPSKPDTDTDGLNDLAEYSRYNFRSTDPNVADSDLDSVPDGVDPEPLYAVSTTLPMFASSPTIDGVIEPTWPRLVPGYYYTQNSTPFSLTTYAGWDANGLYLAIESSRKLRFMVSLDGSGQDGRFESPVRHVDGATDTDNQDNKQNQIGDTWGDGNHIYFAHGLSTVEVYGRGTIDGAQVASSLSAGTYRTEVRLPATLPAGAAYTWYPAGDQTPVVNGLTLVPGQVLGLNVTMSNFEDSYGGEFSGTWTSLFETHSYVDLQLGETTGTPEAPAPAASAGLYLANPYVRSSEIVLRAGPSRTAEVSLYDVLGRKVRTLFEGQIGDDGLRLHWDGTTTSAAEAPPGVYYLRAAVGRSGMQRKVVWLGR